jgi:hypothetical protein
MIASNEIAFFTIVSDQLYKLIGTETLINSFKRFHPDIDLIVFRQDMVDKIFKERGVNFFTAKPTFAKILAPYYKVLCNIDADCIVLGRLDEILKGDYDIGSVINKNDYENRHIENITDDMYLQAGLVASKDPKFWDIWEEQNKKAWNYQCAENDILNFVVYNDPYCSKLKLKVFDKDKDYYGCKSLNREKEFTMEYPGKVLCRGERVWIYHVAKGQGRLPKMQWEELGFPDKVIQYFNVLAGYGCTARYSSV